MRGPESVGSPTNSAGRSGVEDVGVLVSVVEVLAGVPVVSVSSVAAVDEALEVLDVSSPLEPVTSWGALAQALSNKREASKLCTPGGALLVLREGSGLSGGRALKEATREAQTS